MKKLIRILTAMLLLAACVAAAAPTRTSTKQGFTEGPSPVPLCDPNTKKCQMPIAAPDTSAHR